MKALFKLVFLSVATASLTTAASPVLITFDDITASSGISPPFPNVPAGYNGLQWYNFQVLDAVHSPRSGYHDGVVSPNNVAFNNGGEPANFSSSTAFDLDSAYLTAAFNEGLQVEVQGFVGSVLTYDNTYTLSPTAPSLISFDYLGVDEVNFISFGGTPQVGYGGYGTQFAMDNLLINTTPEPGTMGLLILGATLVGLGGRGSRRAEA
jgi:hypothetical protein